MPSIPSCRWLPLWLLLFATSVRAQDEARIWGQVTTRSGEAYEGFIRWDRNEGGWADILDGTRDVPEETYQAWLDAVRGGERPRRFIDLRGYRVSWNEEDPDFPSRSTSGIRFGHLAALTVVDDQKVALTLQSGEWLELSGGATDIGNLRELVVDDPDRGLVELEWEDLERIVFSPVPEGARARARRLYGTVEDRSGRRFAGYLSWDLDEILDSDVLDGEDDDGDDREIPFSDIRSIRPMRRSATVILTSGEELEMSGTNDVDRDNRGVQVSDPALGMVEVEWRDIAEVRFEPAPPGNGHETYDGGHRLEGTVVTESGEEIDGLIAWDADEQWSWELLNGDADGVAFTVEFGFIARIERRDWWGAAVTLTDGRAFELEDSNDVDEDNKGILIASPAGTGPDAPGERVWRHVAWDEFREVRFRHPSRATGDAGGEGGP